MPSLRPFCDIEELNYGFVPSKGHGVATLSLEQLKEAIVMWNITIRAG